MRCEKIQELLLTDYLDGRMTGTQKEQVDQHLRGCLTCRDLLAQARRTAIDLFTEIQPQRLPDSVRQTIMSQVREAQASRGCRWFRNLREIFSPASVVPGWAVTAIVCLIIAGTGVGVFGARQAKQNARIMFLADLAAWSTPAADRAFSYGTALEEYFL